MRFHDQNFRMRTLGTWTALFLFSILLPTTPLFGDPVAPAFDKPLPPKIMKYTREQLGSCFTKLFASSISQTDFNDDGKADYIINLGELCAELCGSAGCRHDIWISRGAGWRKEYSGLMRIEKIVERQAGPILQINLYGSNCDENTSEAARCPKQMRWNGTKLLLEDRETSVMPDELIGTWSLSRKRNFFPT
jgi:hypothetical protein